MPFYRYSSPRKPTTKIEVTFLDRRDKSFVWEAVLDTGSPYTVLPGSCTEPGRGGERVEISPFGYEDGLRLPTRGRPARFGAVGSTPRWHLPFYANIRLDGYGCVELHTVYFEAIDHVIVGTDVLFRKAVCFLSDSYRPGRCWLALLCR